MPHDNMPWGTYSTTNLTTLLFVSEMLIVSLWGDYMKCQRKSELLLFLACSLAFLGSISENVYVYFMARILEVAEKGWTGELFGSVVIYISAILIYFLLFALTGITRAFFLASGTTDIRNRMMKNILERPLILFRKQDDSYYLNLLGADTELYRETRLLNITYIFSCMGSLVSASFFLYRLHPWLLLAGIIVAFVPLLTSKIFAKAARKHRQIVSQTSEKYTEILKECIEGYETVRTMNGCRSFLNRFNISACQKATAQKNSDIINRMSLTVLLMSAAIANVACICVGAYLVAQESLAVSMMLAAVQHSSNLSNQLSNLMEYVVDFRASKPLVEKLKSETQVPCPADGGLMPTGDQSLAYENVSFGFGDRKLYDNLSCSFAPGGCYAILGESGSGKSTLTKLLLKYYDNYEGKITLAGQDIRNLSEEEIYRVVGLVSQSPFLFNASLYENITMFTNDPPKDSAEYGKLLADLNLTALAQRVGDAPLGDFGDNISGGERQRINIARALRSHPAILIFDEPTTGLDPENVALIDQFIFDRKDVTRIVITHNWSEAYLARFDSVLRIGEKA